MSLKCKKIKVDYKDFGKFAEYVQMNQIHFYTYFLSVISEIWVRRVFTFLRTIISPTQNFFLDTHLTIIGN